LRSEGRDQGATQFAERASSLDEHHKFTKLTSMKQSLAEYRTFFREFRQTFKTTGAITPSGRSLARAICRPFAEHDQPIRILEIGAGTGAVTKEIVRHIGPEDRFDAVELNERFVDVLNDRFASEPVFKKVADRCRVLHAAVQELPIDVPYDFVICGVPFNNFSVGLTREIFRHMVKLVAPGGTLTFFEYLWIRRVKVLLASKDERRRLSGVERVLGRYLHRYEYKCDTVWVNFPPALAHHLKLDESLSRPKPRRKKKRRHQKAASR